MLDRKHSGVMKSADVEDMFDEGKTLFCKIKEGIDGFLDAAIKVEIDGIFVRALEDR